MKKTLLALLMSVVMVLSVFTSAFAYTDQQKTEIIEALQSVGLNQVYDTEVPADIELKVASDVNFVDGPYVYTHSGGTVTADYKAMLDMEYVKDTFRTYVTVVDSMFKVNHPESYDSLTAEFDAMPVRADFIVTVTVPAGVTVPASFLSTKYEGFSEQVKHFFNETSRSMTGNVVTIVFELKDPDPANAFLTKKRLEEGLDDYLSDFTLTCNGLTIAAPGTYTIVGDVTGSVYVGGTSKETAPFIINFDAEQVEGEHDTEGGLLQGTLIIKQSTSGGNTRPSTTGGGSGSQSKPGKVIVVIGENEYEYSADKENVVDTTKLPVPEKEGSKFEGWYEDPALTKPAKDIIVLEPGEVLHIYPKFVSAQVPDKFESTDEHFAYVIGYPDGTVRPEDNISREEVATIFYRLLTDEYRAEIAATTNDFADVEADRWSNKAISTMANGGYIVGYNGKFNPEDAITRAEFVTIAARFLESETEAKATFTDIEGHWGEKFIHATSDASWINGYEDNTFRPDENITRAEAMAIFNRILCRRVDKEGLIEGTLEFPDLYDTEWYVYDVLEATNSHKCDERAESEVYENWTELLENRDWTKY